jgi:hypothetical protein
MSYDQWGLIGAGAGSIVGLAWNFVGYKFLVFKIHIWIDARIDKPVIFYYG